MNPNESSFRCRFILAWTGCPVIPGHGSNSNFRHQYVRARRRSEVSSIYLDVFARICIHARWRPSRGLPEHVRAAKHLPRRPRREPLRPARRFSALPRDTRLAPMCERGRAGRSAGWPPFPHHTRLTGAIVGASLEELARGDFDEKPSQKNELFPSG